jgi:hypothetical protein
VARDFATAAANAIKVGFDGIELHAGVSLASALLSAIPISSIQFNFKVPGGVWGKILLISPSAREGVGEGVC